MAPPKTVTLYRYYNTDPDGALRCEEIAAKETPTAYTYGHVSDEEARARAGRPYRMVRKDDIGCLRYAGCGELWMLTRDDEAARGIYMDKLLYLQKHDVQDAQTRIAHINRLVIAMGGDARYPRWDAWYPRWDA